MTKTNKERQSTKCDFSYRNRIWPKGDRAKGREQRIRDVMLMLMLMVMRMVGM